MTKGVTNLTNDFGRYIQQNAQGSCWHGHMYYRACQWWSNKAVQCSLFAATQVNLQYNLSHRGPHLQPFTCYNDRIKYCLEPTSKKRLHTRIQQKLHHSMHPEQQGHQFQQPCMRFAKQPWNFWFKWHSTLETELIFYAVKYMQTSSTQTVSANLLVVCRSLHPYHLILLQSPLL